MRHVFSILEAIFPRRNHVSQECAKVSHDVTKINKNPAFLLLTKQIVTIRREGLVQIG
jgi:hypothetical protein